MIAILRLEAIGDNFASSRATLQQRMRVVRRLPAEMRARAVNPKRPWVAEIGCGWRRTFLRGRRDYTTASGDLGDRGIFVEYILRERGVYEVFELTSWTEARRYFCHIEAGKVIEIDRSEVGRWLQIENAD